MCRHHSRWEPSRFRHADALAWMPEDHDDVGTSEVGRPYESPSGAGPRVVRLDIQKLRLSPSHSLGRRAPCVSGGDVRRPEPDPHCSGSMNLSHHDKGTLHS